jgi:hypothetical protein
MLSRGGEVVSKAAKVILLVLLIISSAMAGSAQTAPRILTAPEIIERVRAAVGYSALTKLDDGLLISGTADFLELKGRFDLRFRTDGRVLHDIQGPIGMSLRFDGTKGWVSNWAGLDRQLEMEDLESFQIEYWVLTNRWLTSDGPFEVTATAEEPEVGKAKLRLKRKGGLLEALLSIDSTTWLPVHLKYLTPGKTQTWALSNYQKHFGVQVPFNMIAVNENATTRYLVENVARDKPASDAFTLSRGLPKDTEWNRDASPNVEIKRARTGHLLVRPLIEGQPAGWFLLDSGAGAMVITPKIADRAQMESFGKVPVRGVGGTIQSPFRRGKRFELGQLVVQNPLYIEIDFTAISRAIGEEVAGICGYDLFLRSIVVLDSIAPSLEIREPSAYQLSQGEWQEMYLDSNIPHIKCRFEGDREDVFRLDTGADNTVSFHSPAVQKYKLLEGRQTRSNAAGGVGGSISMARGRIAWFEISGHRFVEPEVNFSLAKTGVLANAFSAGNIGGAFLRQFRIVFNYGERKIAFIER